MTVLRMAGGSARAVPSDGASGRSPRPRHHAHGHPHSGGGSGGQGGGGHEHMDIREEIYREIHRITYVAPAADGPGDKAGLAQRKATEELQV